MVAAALPASNAAGDGAADAHVNVVKSYDLKVVLGSDHRCCLMGRVDDVS